MSKQINKISTFTLSNEKYINSNFDEINNLKKLGVNITMFKHLKNDDIDNDNIKNIFKDKLSLDGNKYYLLSKIL